MLESRPIRRAMDGPMRRVRLPMPAQAAPQTAQPAHTPHQLQQPAAVVDKSRKAAFYALVDRLVTVRTFSIWALVMVMYFMLHAEILDCLVVGFFAAALLWRISSKLIFGFAIVLLAIIPLFIWLGNSKLSDNYAVYAYYLLVIGVTSAILDLKRDQSKHR